MLSTLGSWVTFPEELPSVTSNVIETLSSVYANWPSAGSTHTNMLSLCDNVQALRVISHREA